VRLMLSDVLGAEVVDESGRRLGHVHDLRIVRDGAPAEPDQAPPYRVEGLIVGRRGLHARLGLEAARRAEPLRRGEPLAWEDVVELGERRIVVRARPA